MPSDLELLDAWGTGDNAAARALIERYFDALYRFFCNKVGEDTDDLIQETLLACVENRARFRGDATFRTYLFAVARNRLYLRFREHHGRDAKIDFGATSIADFATSPSLAAARGQQHRMLLEALRRIPVDMQMTLELYYWEDMTATEIAGALDVPEGTVRSRLRRGRDLLRDKLSRLNAQPSAAAEQLEQWVRSAGPQSPATPRPPRS